MTIRIQYSFIKHGNLSDKFLMDLYKTWRKYIYSLNGKWKPKKVIIFSIRWNSVINSWYGAPECYYSYDVYSLGIQDWHYKKARVKKASKVMNLLCLTHVNKNTEFNKMFLEFEKQLISI